MVHLQASARANEREREVDVREMLRDDRMCKRAISARVTYVREIIERQADLEQENILSVPKLRERVVRAREE